MKILLTGKTGQLGWELERILPSVGNVVAFDRQGLDLADPLSIRRTFSEIRPDLIVNAAAYTAVDQAEDEPELAHAVNAEGPGVLAEEANKIGAALIHYSTDYVFDGRKTSPYTEDDPTGPLNVYGRTKLAGEQAIQAVGIPHLIFRTSWVYSTRGKNFLLTILRLASEREELRIVNDQIGSPNWSRSLADATATVLKRVYGGLAELSVNDVQGIYHMSGSDGTTWYDFASAILQRVKECGMGEGVPVQLKLKRLISIPTSEFPTRAQRPGYSVLSNGKLSRVLGITVPDWQTQLASMISTLDLELSKSVSSGGSKRRICES